MGENGDGPDRYTTPYALIALLGTLVLATAVFLVVYLTGGLEGIFRTAFASLMTLYGTLGGAYFGIKVSSKAADNSEAGRRRAEDKKDEALRALPPK